MPRQDTGGQRSDPHHISTVADFFLGAKKPGAGIGSEVAVPPHAATRFLFVVAAAAAGTSHLSSLTATGLARASLPMPSHPRDEVVPLQVVLDEGTPARPCPGGRGPVLHWVHLGTGAPWGEAALARLRAQLLGSERSPVGICDGLIWCARDTEASSLQMAYALGRLAGVLCPVQVKVLLFPAARPESIAFEPEASSRAGDDSTSGVARQRESSWQIDLFATALPGTAVEILPIPATGSVSALDGGGAGGSEGSLAEFWQCLAGSLKQEALARRRTAIG